MSQLKFIRGQVNLSGFRGPCVATIGVFDGLHRGHQAVIRQLQDKAQALNLPAVLICFEPQPLEFFRPELTVPRITRLRDKLMIVREWGVDAVLCLRFNTELAALSAEAFVETILVHGLQIKHLVVGDDFRFGQGRAGDFALLQQLGQRFGFGVEPTHTLTNEQGVRISSTRVREAIAAGDFATAEALLGRPYCLYGKVHHGDKRGRLLGFPTINIGSMKPMVVHGVYVVRVRGIDGRVYNGVANVGRRPTIKGLRRLLEVYLLDYQGECYGARVQVEFIAKLRDERKFPSVEALAGQIAQDVRDAQEVLRG